MNFISTEKYLGPSLSILNYIFMSPCLITGLKKLTLKKKKECFLLNKIAKKKKKFFFNKKNCLSFDA